MRSGRPPKPAGQKRNRNKPAVEWTILPTEGPKGRVPSLPRHLKISAEVRDWWKEVWKSPMATQWQPEDRHSLMELALLRDKLLSGTTSVAAEVRQRTDEFGLTPAGRRALKWALPTDEHMDLVPESAKVRHLQVIDA